MFTVMKIAHVILTHANPQQLQRLVSKLCHDNADIYIHLDLKTDITPFAPIAAIKQVYFIQNRVKVYWGGYSIVQATINSFEEVMNSSRVYSHINLLSGQDYPIKKTEDIHRHLAANEGKIFMHFLSVENEWQEAKPRISDYHFINWNLPFGTYRVEQMVNKLLPRRKLPEGIVPMGRSQWFTATPASIAYILQYIKENSWVAKFFRLSWAPDEMIFQTILYNSPFRAAMVNDNLLYVDWSLKKPNPKVLTMEDAPALKKTEKLFARKFNIATDSEILDYIDHLTS